MKLFQSQVNPYLILNFIILTGLMIFMPLSRGGVHEWQQTVMAIGVHAGLVILFVEHKVKDMVQFIPTELSRPIVLLIAWMLLSAFLSAVKPVAFTSIYKACIYCGFYYLVIHCVRSRSHRLYLVNIILLVAVVLSVIGFFQLAGITFPWWQYKGLGEKEFMTATFGNHNHLAGYLEMTIPLAVVLFLTQRKEMVKMVYGGISFLLVVSHILTLSRGGWVSLLLAMLGFMFLFFVIHGVSRKKSLFILLCAFLLITAVGILGSNVVDRAVTLTEEETLTSMSGRSIAWNGTREMIKNHSLFGAGPGSFSLIYTQYQPPGMQTRFYYAHNDYLQYIAEFGVPIVLFMVWFIYIMHNKAIKKMKSRSRQTWGISLGAFTGIVAIIFHSFVDFNLHIPANALLFTLLFALVMVEIRSTSSKERFS